MSAELATYYDGEPDGIYSSLNELLGQSTEVTLDHWATRTGILVARSGTSEFPTITLVVLVMEDPNVDPLAIISTIEPRVPTEMQDEMDVVLVERSYEQLRKLMIMVDTDMQRDKTPT